MSDPFNNPTPQFGTAEYAGKPGSDRCRFCQQPIAGRYYRTNDAMTCPACAEKMRREVAMDTHAAYVRALAAGIGAAVVGLIGYALIAILLQGWVISYMSIGVGWIVGTAMMKRRCPWRRFPSGFIWPTSAKSRDRRSNSNCGRSSASWRTGLRNKRRNRRPERHDPR